MTSPVEPTPEARPPADTPPPSLAVTDPAAWRAMVLHVWNGSLDHRINGLAAEVAFFSLFALPPMLLAVFGAVGFIGQAAGPDVTLRVREDLMLKAGQFLTDDTVREVVGPTVDKVLREGGRADLLSLGLLFALVSASRAADAMIDALHIAYRIDERFAMWRRRGLALLFTFVGVVWGGVVLPLLVVGPDFGRAIAGRFDLQWAFDSLWEGLYWPVVLALLIVTLAAVYHFIVPWRPRYVRGLPGAAVAMLLWIGGGAALRGYVNWAVESSPIVGSLGTPMVVLLWLYFTSFSVLFGAEVNSALEETWPSASRRQKKDALREAVDELKSAGEDVAPVSVTGRKPPS